MATGNRHVPQHLLGDLEIFAHWARGLENGKQRLEWIAVDARDPLHLSRPRQGVPVHPLAGHVPVSLDGLDVRLRQDAGDRPEPFGQPRTLAQPTELHPGQGRRQQEHLRLPTGEEASPLLTPLDVPVPDWRADQQGKREIFRHGPCPFHLAVRTGGQGSEQRGKMLAALGGRLRPPDTRSLKAQVCEGRGFELDERPHLGL